MNSLSRLFARQLSLTNQCFVDLIKTSNNMIKRNYFSPEKIGITEFYKKSEKFSRAKNEKAIQTASFISKIRENNHDIENLKSDLKLLLYTAKLDEELNTLIDGIRRYNSIVFKAKPEKIFYFDTCLMELLYVLKRTDKALDLFFETENSIVNSKMACILLMDMLIKEKRYNNLIEVYKKGATSYFKRKISNQGLELYVQALYEKNDLDSYHLAKSYYQSLRKSKTVVLDKVIKKIYLLAIDQKDYQYALELVSHLKDENPYKVMTNLKMIPLCRMKKINNVIYLAETMFTFQKEDRVFYHETLQELKDLALSCQNENARTKLKEIIEKCNQDKIMLKKLKQTISESGGLVSNAERKRA